MTFSLQVPEIAHQPLSRILSGLRWLRSVYGSANPFEDDVAVYKENDVNLGSLSQGSVAKLST